MRILLVGPTDVGKSTLSLELARRAARRDGEAYRLDLDVGQGDLPGACTLFRHTPQGAYVLRRALVGRVSPMGAGLELLAASLRLARLVPEPAFLVVDTDGLTEGAFARALRYHQADAVAAREVWVIGAEGLASVFAGREDLKVRVLPPPPGVREKPREERRQRRAARLAAHFAGAACRVLPLPVPDARRLWALLDAKGWLLGYGRVEAHAGRLGLIRTPVRARVARLERTELAATDAPGVHRLLPGWSP